MSNLQSLVGKVLSDPNFAQVLLEDPEGTLQEMNVEATPEVLAALDGLDTESVQRLAAAFGDDKAAG